MRIIGGEYRSRLIKMPKGVDIRPTQDKVRGAVFNIIGDLNDKKVLELFAGSGAFGIEAISRGAVHVTFVDNNSRCVETVRKNVESLGIDMSRYDVIRENAPSVFPRLERGGELFDIVFMDPPYHGDLAKKCLINMSSHDILTPIALVIIEHYKKDMLEADPRALILEKERRYGDTVISMFRRNPAAYI